MLLGYIVGLAAPGVQYLVWVVMPLVVLFFVRRYPREEICAVFGLAFGWLLLVVCGGAVYLAVNEQLLYAGLWLVCGLVISIVFHKPVFRRLVPTMFIVETFGAMVGPMAMPQREPPFGCILVTSETLFFLTLLMMVGVLGPVLWLTHFIMYKVFMKMNREKKIGWVKVLLFIFMNIVVLFILYHILKNLGAEAVVGKLLEA